MDQRVNWPVTRVSASDIGHLSTMLDASVDCIKLVDLSGKLIKMNRSGCEALGVPKDETDFGMKWIDLLPSEVRRRAKRALDAACAGRKSSFAGKSKLPGRKPIYWDNILTPVRGPDGQVGAILCLSRDVTRQRVAQEKLKLASEIDSLTGLPNRRLFKSRSERAIKRTGESAGLVGLLIVDLDEFKGINDHFGHDAGDFVLKKAARQFETCRASNEFVARLGGDEFAVLVNDLEAPDQLHHSAEKFLTALHEPIRYKGNPFAVRMSIGGAVVGGRGQDLSELMKASDVALYEAKSAGRNTYRIAYDAHRAAFMQGLPLDKPAVSAAA